MNDKFKPGDRVIFRSEGQLPDYGEITRKYVDEFGRYNDGRIRWWAKWDVDGVMEMYATEDSLELDIAYNSPLMKALR